MKQLVKMLKLKPYVKFTGKVPHELIAALYSVLDIVVLPRIPLPVTEVVPPLKPFEAMSMAKLVVGSNVDAINDIIIDGVNGFKFKKGNCADLTRVLIQLVHRGRSFASKAGANARKWVIQHRDWKSIAKNITIVYDHLTAPRVR